MGPLVIELDEANAPATTSNFIEYVKSGFYNGTCFHRVVPGFVVQAGGFSPDLLQKQAGEPIKSEWKDGMKNKRGTVAMSRSSGRPDSATSQFFINIADNANFDMSRDGAGYTVFGRVVEGMSVVDRMAKAPTALTKGMRDVPVEPIVIEKAEWMAERPPRDASEPSGSPERPSGAPGTQSSGAKSGSLNERAGNSGDSSGAAPQPVGPAPSDPTTWLPARLAFSWAQTPSDTEEISTATQVSTEGGKGLRILYGPKTPVTAGPQVVTVIAKAGDLGLIQLTGNGSKGFVANFDLRKGEVTHRGSSTPNASADPLGDGWYRLSATFDYRGPPEEVSIRRLVVIDDPMADWHSESSVRGHFFLASPKVAPAETP